MRILQIHKYFSRQKGGGSVTAFFETKKLLEERGHEVAVFSMKDEKNEKSPYEKYFVNNFDINKLGMAGKAKYFSKSIYNREACQKIEKLILDFQPEVAHVHNIYHYLTPSILQALKKHNIPTVFKLSDYKLICPNYKLFNKGKICEKCKKHKYWQCFFNKCLKDSYTVSLVGSAEAYFHCILKSYSAVDLFLSPSEFMKRKCAEFGVPEKKIRILRNVMNTKDYRLKKFLTDEDVGKYILCYGRISPEKGIVDLIEAFELISPEEKKDWKLFLAGKGPQKKEIQNLIKERGLENKIGFLGFKTGDELKKLIAGSGFVVVPSIWYDNSPLVISEAGLLERPVVVSDLGGSKEMVANGKSGLVFEGGNREDLKEKIVKMMKTDQTERKKMGQAGRENILEINGEEQYYQKLMEYYREARELKNGNAK